MFFLFPYLCSAIITLAFVNTCSFCIRYFIITLAFVFLTFCNKIIFKNSILWGNCYFRYVPIASVHMFSLCSAAYPAAPCSCPTARRRRPDHHLPGTPGQRPPSSRHPRTCFRGEPLTRRRWPTGQQPLLSSGQPPRTHLHGD